MVGLYGELIRHRAHYDVTVMDFLTIVGYTRWQDDSTFWRQFEGYLARGWIFLVLQ